MAQVSQAQQQQVTMTALPFMLDAERQAEPMRPPAMSQNGPQAPLPVPQSDSPPDESPTAD